MTLFSCLLAKKDDLHDFACHWLSTASVLSMNAPLHLCKDFGGAVCGVLHREGMYQVELISFGRNLDIPAHVHPGTDSIDFPLSGGVRVIVNDREILHAATHDGFLRKTKNQGLRINANDAHSGRVLDGGAVFLSIQRWTGAFAHIGENYVGGAVSPKHKEMMHDHAP